MALRGRPRAEAILDFLKTEYRPELEQLSRLGEQRSPEAPEFAGHLVNQAAEMLELRQYRPELFEEQMESRRLDRRSQELAEAYRRATGEERERLGVELKKVLETAFAARLRLQSKQLEAMREELQQQERRLEAREQSRERIVERRFQQLTGQGDDLEW
jgi:hypothetical protein